MRRTVRCAALLASSVLALSSCGTDPEQGAGDAPAVSAGEDGIIEVPADAATITDAVAAAAPGDVIEVSPGVYTESVRIETEDITLRGTERNGVVLDGEGLRANGITVVADGVTVENLTVANHTINGVLFTGVDDEEFLNEAAPHEGSGDGVYGHGDTTHTEHSPEEYPPIEGFAIRYVTSYNNCLYGLYAFDAVQGVIEHSYVSGSADSGIYVGQCKPCDIVVQFNTSERNAIGYEGTNASDIAVVGNRFTRNRVGMTTNSQDIELLVPQERASVIGNLVAANFDDRSPETARGGFGTGIVTSGGQQNLLARNRVDNNPLAGIMVISGDGLPPIGNEVRGNVGSGNGDRGVAYLPSGQAPGQGNCFAENQVEATVPADLAERFGCPPSDSAYVGDAVPSIEQPEGLIFLDVPVPPDQPEMPADEQGQDVPGESVLDELDLASFGVPEPAYVPPGTTALPPLS